MEDLGCLCAVKVILDVDVSKQYLSSGIGCQLVTHDNCTDQILHPCLPSCFDEQKIQNAFIRMFASLLYNYRTGFVDHLDDHSSSTITASNTTSSGRIKPLYFSKEKFLKHSDKDSRVCKTLSPFFLSGS
jgi:hypothetical protein